MAVPSARNECGRQFPGRCSAAAFSAAAFSAAAFSAASFTSAAFLAAALASAAAFSAAAFAPAAARCPVRSHTDPFGGSCWFLQFPHCAYTEIQTSSCVII